MGIKTNLVSFLLSAVVAFVVMPSSQGKAGMWCALPADLPANITSAKDIATATHISAFVGSAVNACVVAPGRCSGCSVQVDGVKSSCQAFTLNGTLVAIVIFPVLVDNHTLDFLFVCEDKGLPSIDVFITVQDVKVSNVTMEEGCNGVTFQWMSPPASLYQVRVTCDKIQHLNTSTPNTSIFLKVDDFFGCENCHIMLAAITPAGLGPEKKSPFQLYTDPNNSVVRQDFWIRHLEDVVAIVLNVTTVDPYCASAFPISIVTLVDGINYTNVVNFSDVYNPQVGGVVEAEVAILPKHLPKTEITVITRNPAGDKNVTKLIDTYETRAFFFENTSVSGEVILGCEFVEGSSGNGCQIEVEGRENVSVIRIGLRGTTKYKISEPGTYLVKVSDLDFSGHTFGPVLTDNFTVFEQPTEGPSVTEEGKPDQTGVIVITIAIIVIVFAIVAIVAIILVCKCSKGRRKNSEEDSSRGIYELAPLDRSGSSKNGEIMPRQPDGDANQASGAMSQPIPVTGTIAQTETSTTTVGETTELLPKRNKELQPPQECEQHAPPPVFATPPPAFPGGAESTDESTQASTTESKSVPLPANIAPQTLSQGPRKPISTTLDPGLMNVKDPNATIVAATRDSLNPTQAAGSILDDDNAFYTAPKEERSSNPKNSAKIVVDGHPRLLN